MTTLKQELFLELTPDQNKLHGQLQEVNLKILRPIADL